MKPTREDRRLAADYYYSPGGVFAGKAQLWVDTDDTAYLNDWQTANLPALAALLASVRAPLEARAAELEGAIRAAALDEYAPPNDGPRCGLCSSLLVVCDKWNIGCAGPRLRAALKEG